MARSANRPVDVSQDLPAPRRAALGVADVLALGALRSAVVVAGGGGRDRRVERVGVLEAWPPFIRGRRP